MKSDTERKASRWIIGENDIIFMTRKLGIINIEVKGEFVVFKQDRKLSAYFIR